jgi:hypothetical protein
MPLSLAISQLELGALQGLEPPPERPGLARAHQRPRERWAQRDGHVREHFHAAGQHDVGIAALDEVSRVGDSLDGRRTRQGHGIGRGLLRQPGGQHQLAGEVGVLHRPHHVSVDDVIDLARIDARALQELDGDRAS